MNNGKKLENSWVIEKSLLSILKLHFVLMIQVYLALIKMILTKNAKDQSDILH